MKIENLPCLGTARVTLLAENTARGRGVLGEHGLCWWIETGAGPVLFDLGQGLVLASNAGVLGCDLTSVGAIVLSHGHYDHVNGWRALPEAAQRARVYAHPAALRAKFQWKAGRGVESANEPRVLAALSEARLHLVEGPVEIVPGLWATGEVPRMTDYEDTGGAFCLDAEGREPDSLLDDQALFFRCPAGVVVILGCAHAGIINTLRYVQAITGIRLHAAIGGTHLLHASEERLCRTVDDLRAMELDWLGPNHCTGDAAAAYLRQAFPGRVLECHAGQHFTFPLPNPD